MTEVRLFAAARDAAGGQTKVTLDATDVPGLVSALSDQFGERMAQVLAISTLVSAGTRLSPDDPLPPDTPVDILPPFAGG